jgi:hypothetical protein
LSRRRTECKKKWVFKDRSKAEYMISGLQGKLKKPLRAYLCDICEGYIWHITSRTGKGVKKSTKQRRRARAEKAIIAAWENEGGALYDH